MTGEGASIPELVGRGDELADLTGFLHAAARAGGARMVAGEAGMGKSALLRAVGRVAVEQMGARVLWASGAEFEADLGYAGLHQLLLRAAPELDALPPTDAGVLRSAFGLESGHPPELLPLTTATLGLLTRMREARPLLVVVDDVQWVDRKTALLLSLVARRLAGSGVAVLLAQRSGHDTCFDRGWIPTLQLAPLSDEDAHALLRAYHPHLHPSVRQRIVMDAGGNPLALIELPRGLTADQGAAADILPSTLPLNERLRRLFADRVAALPAPSRRLLLLAALHHGDDAELMRVVAGAAADLVPAEESALVAVDARSARLRFTHPLIRAAVVDLTSAPERRAAHRRLAELTGSADVRALHLADSVLGVDDDVAGLLDGVAESALARGEVRRAVGVLLRAADLTSVPADRGRRLAAAAYLGANVNGTLACARALLEQARGADPDVADTLQAATAAAAHLLNSDDGDVDTAHLMLVRALAAVAPDQTEPRVVHEAVHTLMLVCAYGARADLWAAFEEAVEQWGALLPSELRVAAVTFADPARTTGHQLTVLDELVASVADSVDAVRVLEIAIAGHYVDRAPSAALERVSLAGRAGGPVPLAAQALVMRAMTAFHEGRWDDTESLADEGISLCVEHGYRLLEWGMLNPKMLLAAARGDAAYLADVRDRLGQSMIPRQMLAARGFTANVDGLAALSQGRYGEAHEAYSSIARPGSLPPYVQAMVWNPLDVVEAAVRSGHPEDARRHAATVAATLAPISPRLAFQSAAAAALAAPGGDHDAFACLVDDPDALRWPFPLARIELAYGERLRLERAMRRARPHLERAAELFDRLGARPWSERTEAALRATGRTRVNGAGEPTLTPQELEVARLAASGLSNRQIGERLFVSPRTVGAHLYRAFPKLGVTSRAALRDALTEQTE